jgi:uncharacterized protein (TIGR02145 family)
MKKTFLIYQLIIVAHVLFLITDCKKEEPAAIPLLSTIPVTNVTASTATSGGNITSDGHAAITARGVCWSATANPTTSDLKTTDGVGIGQFVSEITGLTAGLTFHVRAYATNSVGTAYGIDLSSSTLGQAPSSVTQSATNVTVTGATLNGSVNANYLSTVVTFEYGLTTGYGSTATAAQSPVTGITFSIVSADITGLTVGMTYHFRIKAINTLGTTFGNDVTFTTEASGTVTDVDGNIYNTITIGTQVWMKENLKTTKYNDGTAISNITDNTAWAASTAGAYSDYSNTPANSTTYGRLYNWYTVDNNAATKVVSNGGKNVCPTGWHIPSDDEWTTLTDYLINNGYGYAGSGSNIAKSMAATSGWTTNTTAGSVGNDQASNNRSGFSALPGGSRDYYNGAFVNVVDNGLWWSSTQTLSTYAFYRYIIYANTIIVSNLGYKQSGFSVRCLRDL